MVLGLCIYAGISYIFNFLVCFLHHFIIFLLFLRSLGKVFHGSEETMRVVFFKEEICKIEVYVLQENFH